MARRRGRDKVARDVAAATFRTACSLLDSHPVFSPLLTRAHVLRFEKNACPPEGWAVVFSTGTIHVHPTRRGEPGEWVYVLAHCLLHLGFGHFQAKERPREWNAACDCVAAGFLAHLKLGTPPEDIVYDPTATRVQTEEELYRTFCEQGIPEVLGALSTAGRHLDMLLAPIPRWHLGDVDWKACFGQGLAQAVASAVREASSQPTPSRPNTPAQRARAWFINHYPLLGSLAAAFDIIEDPRVCHRLAISVAAVDAESREIYMNPAAGLDDHERRFVMAHELLHVSLRHQARREGRDPFLWNVACDYVINGWLIELGLGELPKIGVSYDPQLKGLSAEAVYDRIVTDLRRYRKLCTFRGVGIGDLLARGSPDWWNRGDGVELDAFYRSCLTQGLAYHEEQGRGHLPAGLVEEIRALSQPPIPWDVELAQWFDDHFSPLQKVRSYARPSRRQSATPDIPRPRWVPVVGAMDGRTFGVVLDTSGSMDRDLLARALGAIASYSLSRDVPAARVVFCDADAYDQGFMPPEDIAGRVRVKGRGGTVLQPGVDLLEKAEDFPKDGPLLIITDGYCDRLHLRREHAFLIPQGRHLPFVPKGRVFRIR